MKYNIKQGKSLSDIPCLILYFIYDMKYNIKQGKSLSDIPCLILLGFVPLRKNAAVVKNSVHSIGLKCHLTCILLIYIYMCVLGRGAHSYWVFRM